MLIGNAWCWSFLFRGLDRGDDDIVAAELRICSSASWLAPSPTDEHGHHAADAENHAQHGQERPQLVKQQVLDAQGDIPNDAGSPHGSRLLSLSIAPSTMYSRFVASSARSGSWVTMMMVLP